MAITTMETPTCPVCGKPVTEFGHAVLIPEGLGQGMHLHVHCHAKTLIAFTVAPPGGFPCIFPDRALADEEARTLKQDEGLDEPIEVKPKTMTWGAYYRLPEHSGY